MVHGALFNRETELRVREAFLPHAFMHVSILSDHSVLDVVFMLSFTAADRHIDALPCLPQRCGADIVCRFFIPEGPGDTADSAEYLRLL